MTTATRRISLALLFTAVTGLGQSDGDKIVSVPKKYVSSEGLSHQAPSSISSFVGVGKEIGVAINDGLGAVVDKAEKFGTTRVGMFVMVMIALKIVGPELIHIVFGIPLLVTGFLVFSYVARRLFFGYRVLEKKEGRVKTYVDHPAYKFDSGDARMVAGVLLGLAAIVFTVVMLCIIFLAV